MTPRHTVKEERKGYRTGKRTKKEKSGNLGEGGEGGGGEGKKEKEKEMRQVEHNNKKHNRESTCVGDGRGLYACVYRELLF